MSLQSVVILTVGGLLSVAVGLVWLSRFGRPDPKNRCIVHLSDSEIVCERPDGTTECVIWSDLQTVEVLSTSDLLMGPDEMWILHGTRSGCVIPSTAIGADALLERLQTLPGFDNDIFWEAMTCKAERSFTCWQKTE